MAMNPYVIMFIITNILNATRMCIYIGLSGLLKPPNNVFVLMLIAVLFESKYLYVYLVLWKPGIKIYLEIGLANVT